MAAIACDEIGYTPDPVPFYIDFCPRGTGRTREWRRKNYPMPPAGQGFYFFFACVSRSTERRRLPPSHWSDWKLFSSKVLVFTN